MNNDSKILIVGAGPAGLTAAYLLSKKGYLVTVLESDPKYVGGLSRTVNYKGYLFDIGGHRFFSKSKEVNDFWNEILPTQFLERTRKSRIYYDKKYLSYPINPIECFAKLSFKTTLSFTTSFIKNKLLNFKKVNNFEDWMIKKFGESLYQAFFKSYTEKVWGVDCKNISSDWASQRIQGLSILSILMKAISINKDGKVKTLITNFKYPKRGPGMLWEECAKKCISNGVKIHMGHNYETAKWDRENSIWRIKYKDIQSQAEIEESFDHFISSTPLTGLLKSLESDITIQSKEIIQKFKYRDFITVALIVNEKNSISDNWLYIHEKDVKVGRVQNFNNWSEYMVPEKDHTCFGMEYFCNENDSFWSLTDEEISNIARKEILHLDLVKDEKNIKDFKVIKVKKAYPVYHESYKEDLANIVSLIKDKTKNLHLIGRSGMHRYNNQDHSIMTAMLTVKNIEMNEERFDPWKVNQDAQYIEG